MAGGSVTETGCAITTTAPPNNNFATSTTGGGTLNLSSSTINTTGSGGVGAFVNGAGSSTILQGVQITTSGATADGIRAGSSGGSASMTGGSISVSGFSAYGAVAYGTGAIIDLHGVAISATGSASNGLYAPGSVSGGVINAFDSTITISGPTGSGAFAEGAGSTVNINNTDIETNKSSGFGARALNQAAVNVVNGSSIITRQANSSGIFADQNSTATFNNSTIETLQNFSFGLYSQGGSVISAQNSSIVTRGASGNGLYAVGPGAGTKIVGDNLTAETFGADAYGARIIFGAQIDLTNSRITTHGADAHGVDMYASTGVVNTFNATNTQINSSGTTLNVWGGTGNLTLNNVQTSSGVNRFLVVGTPPTLPNFFAAADPDYTPPVVPASPSSPVIANLVASNSTFVGDSIVALGDTANVTLQSATTLTGAFTTLGTSNVQLASGSVWNMTASSNVTNLTNTASTINFLPPVGGAFKTLTAVTYVGNGGTIGLNTFLGADGSPSDLLVIDGGSATGATALRIANAGGPGAKTTGNGILVVDAINGGTTAAGSFHLAGPVVAGAYTYGLFRGSVDASAPDDWFLRSGGMRPDVPTQAGLPPLATQYGFTSVGTFHERMGDPLAKGLAKNAGANCSSSNMAAGTSAPGAWGRLIGENGKQSNNAFSSTGPDYSWQMAGLQTGFDVIQRDNTNSCDHIGVFFGAGGLTSNVSPLAAAAMGRINLDAYSVGAYWSRLNHNGVYLDGITQGTYYTSNANTGLDSYGTRGLGVTTSIEAGVPISIGNGLWIEPQLQFIYQHVSFDNALGSTALVMIDPTDALRGRVGARLVRPWETGSVWLRGNIWHEFIGSTNVTVAGITGQNGLSFEVPFRGTWAEIGFGINGDIYHNVSLFATGAYQHNIDNNDRYAWNGRVGVTYKW